MNVIKRIYTRTSFYTVFHYHDDGGIARSNLLFAVMVQAIVGGFTGGIFYTGFFAGYGFNIVNISIITVVPYVANLFSLFSPYILERFEKRRTIMTVTRILYYTLNIIGVTLLPQLVHGETARIVGLIAIVFITNVINALFSSGYSVWHMEYITPNIRMGYFAATTLVSNIMSSVVLILTSAVADSLTGDGQLRLITFLRYLSYAVAMADVYFLQVPKEPKYKKSGQKLSLLNVFKLPLSNQKFILTMLIYGLYAYIVNLSGSVANAWLLEQVHVSYLYINVINALYALFIVGTKSIWNRAMDEMGTFKLMAFNLLLQAPTYLIYGFVNAGNYLWLMTIVRLSQHCLGMGLTYSVNNLIYINLPETDKTNYLSFYTIVGNATTFLGMMTGTTVVAAMGDSVFNIFGYGMSSVPMMLVSTGVLFIGMSALIMLLRKKVEPDVVK